MFESREPHGTFEVGHRLAGYLIEAKLGEGGMGVVFRARSEQDGKVIALKVLKGQFTADKLYRRRFIHEARAAREVQHRHLVPILDAGEADGCQFLTMRYMAAGSLEDWIKRGPMTLADVLRVMAEIASGLDMLHRQGIVHRDVKPTNIMFDGSGTAALTDFGLAKGPAYTVLTKPGQVMGTVDYLAPELIRGQPATAACDIYAFGCVVFECISGSPPFHSRSLFEIGLAHLQDEPPDLCGLRADLNPQLSWAVLQALAKEPERRPSTATAYSHMVHLAAQQISR